MNAGAAPRFTTRMSELPDDVAAMTYEQARDDLILVVQQLEAGDQPLEGSLALWERGEALAARCQQWLDGARARLDEARGATATTDQGTRGATAEATAPGDVTADPEDAR